MFLINTDNPGREFTPISMVSGSARVTTFWRIGEKHLEKAKRMALRKMAAQARGMCADGIINVRFTMSATDYFPFCAVIVSGTAVKLKPKFCVEK